jgi:hypothetical protein
MKAFIQSLFAVLIGGMVPPVGLLAGSALNIWDLPFPIGLAWICLVLAIAVIIYLVLDMKDRSSIAKALRWFGYCLTGTLLLIPLGLLFDTMHWPIFNTWTLAHGAFIIALPALSFIAFFALRLGMKSRHPPSPD